MECTSSPGKCYSHIIKIHNFATEKSAEITRLAAAGGSLVVSFSDGRVALYEWISTGGLSSLDAPREKLVWNLPAASGPATALSACMLAAGISVFVGTQAGHLLRLGPTDNDMSNLGTHRSMASVTALLFCPGIAMPSSHDMQGSSQMIAQLLFSADTSGRVMRTWLLNDGDSLMPEAGMTGSAEVSSSEVCADLHASVLALELSEWSGRLLVSTAERIAVIDHVLEHALGSEKGCMPMRCVGSKPHRGQLTATFSRTFGPEALIAARPGGRLWVAEGSTGTVQTTLKFQLPNSEDKANLGRLISLDHGKAVSWIRAEPHSYEASEAAPVYGSVGSVVVLDLEAIAVCRTWSLAPVVDVVRCGPGRLLFAHATYMSMLLLYSSPSALLQVLLADCGARLHDDPIFLEECLEQAMALHDALQASLSPPELLVALRPLTNVMSAISSKDQISSLHAVAETETAASFKQWIGELENNGANLIRKGSDPTQVLAISPLANFPVAGNMYETANPAEAVSCGRVYKAILIDHAACDSNMWSIGEGMGTGSPDSERHLLSPKLLRRCRTATKAASASAAAAAAAGSTIERPAVPSPRTWVNCAVAPQPSGTVMRLLEMTPFSTSLEVLQFFSILLQWLIGILECDLLVGCSGVPVDVATPASYAFELLCLHFDPCTSKKGRSSWPCLRTDVACSRLAQANDWHSLSSLAATSLAGHLRPILAAVASSIQEAQSLPQQGKKDASDIKEPWATCASCWTCEVACSFCERLLSRLSIPPSVFERCLLRANGLAALGGGWDQVVSWLRKRIPLSIAPKLATCSINWDAAMLALDQQMRTAGHPSCGIGELHGLIAAAAAISGPGEQSLQAGDFLWARRIFQLALLRFPEVLPWNMTEWMRNMFMDSAARSSLPVAESGGRCASIDILAAEFAQYLLRLIPTCSRWTGLTTLLETSIQVALCGRNFIEPLVDVHRGRNRIVDALVERYWRHLTQEVFVKLRYPFGIIDLVCCCETQGVTSNASSAEGHSRYIISENSFNTIVVQVVHILDPYHVQGRSLELYDDGPHVPHHHKCPVCVPLDVGRFQSKREDPPKMCSTRQHSAMPSDHMLPSRFREKGHTKPPVSGTASSCIGECPNMHNSSSCCFFEEALCTPLGNARTYTCTSCGDVELARTLLQLCEGRSARWEHLLKQLFNAFARDSAIKHDHNVPRNDYITPLNRLLAACALIRPGAGAAAACAQASASGAFHDTAATDAAMILWTASKSSFLDDQNFFNDAGNLLDVTASSTNSRPGNSSNDGTWLELPSASNPPPAPLVQNWCEPQRPKSFAPSDDVCAGFHRSNNTFVDVSIDGLFARHRDDTGDEMHGVLMSAEPLVPGRSGLYFELELDEVRPEEAYDGLTVGVTATDPLEVFEIPATAEHIPQTWAVGYDGQMWDAGTGSLSQIDWDPRCLVKGDTIGVLVTSSEGELLVFRNGIACCPGPRGIPVGTQPLYAVVDLLGAARAVRWRVGAQLPTTMQ